MTNADIQSHFDILAPFYHTTTDWVCDPAITALITNRVQQSPVLDVGAGPGTLMPALSQAGHSPALNLDLSLAMCVRARQGGGVAVQGAAEALPVRSGAIGTVLCRQGLHYFDATLALAEWRRVLCPGGIAVVAQIGSTSRAQAVFWREIKSIVQPLRRLWFAAEDLPSFASSHGWRLIDQQYTYIDNARPITQFFAETLHTPSERRVLLDAWKDRAPAETFFDSSDDRVFFRQYWLIWSMVPMEGAR
jgi:ubiquinone/menaquinone biosynthesis C-methylase UbiE